MSKYEDLTVDQLLAAIESMNRNAKLALAAGDFGLAAALDDKVTGLEAELAHKNDQPQLHHNGRFWS
jgi:hypothetical protein